MGTSSGGWVGNAIVLSFILMSNHPGRVPALSSSRPARFASVLELKDIVIEIAIVAQKVVHLGGSNPMSELHSGGLQLPNLTLLCSATTYYQSNIREA